MNLLYGVSPSANKARNKFIVDKQRTLSYFLIIWFIVSGALSKIDMYTDVAFLTEVNAWDNHTTFGIIILAASIIIFILTIIFQLWTLLVFTFINQKDTIRPLTSNTTRLLLCADMKLLAIMNDKFTVSYYENFGCFSSPTVKVLAFIKLVFEDILQFVLQIIYILILNRKKFTVLYITATFASSILSIIIAIYVIFSSTGSELHPSKLKELRDYDNDEINPPNLTHKISSDSFLNKDKRLKHNSNKSSTDFSQPENNQGNHLRQSQSNSKEEDEKDEEPQSIAESPRKSKTKDKSKLKTNKIDKVKRKLSLDEIFSPK